MITRSKNNQTHDPSDRIDPTAGEFERKWRILKTLAEGVSYVYITRGATYGSHETINSPVRNEKLGHLVCVSFTVEKWGDYVLFADGKLVEDLTSRVINKLS